MLCVYVVGDTEKPEVAKNSNQKEKRKTEMQYLNDLLTATAERVVELRDIWRRYGHTCS